MGFFDVMKNAVSSLSSDKDKATPHSLHLQTKPPSKMLSG